MSEPRIVVSSEMLPRGQHWADHAPRKLTQETHILQTVRVKPEMPFRDFLALFLWDEDLGIRFERVSDDCESGAEVEILWRREDEIEISVGAKRDKP